MKICAAFFFINIFFYICSRIINLALHEAEEHEVYNTRQTYPPLPSLEQKSLCGICQHRTLCQHRVSAKKRCGQFAVEAEGCGRCRT